MITQVVQEAEMVMEFYEKCLTVAVAVTYMV